MSVATRLFGTQAKGFLKSKRIPCLLPSEPFLRHASERLQGESCEHLPPFWIASLNPADASVLLAFWNVKIIIIDEIQKFVVNAHFIPEGRDGTVVVHTSLRLLFFSISSCRFIS
jgi:hypothetical protein